MDEDWLIIGGGEDEYFKVENFDIYGVGLEENDIWEIKMFTVLYKAIFQI